MNNTNQFGLPDEPPEGTELIDNEKFSRKAVTARISPEDIENVLNKLDFFDKTITPTKTFRNEEEKQNYITSTTLEDIAKRINPDLIEGRRYAEPVTEEERKLAKAAGTSAISNINVLKDLAWAKQSNAKEYLYAATKGIGIALATMVDNTVGTAAGLVNSIGSDEPLSDFINNPVSAVIQDFEAELENVLPTYYPSDWEQRNTGQKVFTSNFWADNVLKNLGFAIGTYLSGAGAGALISKGLKAETRRIIGRKLGEKFGEKLAKGELDDLARIITTDASKTNLALSGLEIDKIIKTASTLERTNRLITGVSSTLLGIQGEARVEALNARDQIMDKLSNAVDEKGNKLFGDDEVVKYANSLMNSIFIMNLAILAPTEFLQFGSHFLGSYRISNSIKHSIEGDILKGFSLKVTPKFLRPINTAVKLVQNGTFEGSQEYLQFIAENTGYSVVDDIIDNPDAFKNVSNLYSSFIESIPEGIDRATNSEGAINFLSGFVLGTLGIPTFQKGNFISGGIYEVLKTDKYNRKQAKEIVDYLNKNIDILRSYANFNIAGSALQLAKEAALKDNDVFKHENAESELIFQLLSTLNSVGRLDDFVSQSKAFTNIDLSKPEGQNLINEIKELSIIKDESGNVTSNAFESFSDQEIADIVVKRNKKLIERAKYVKELSNRVKDLMPGQDIHTQSKFIHDNYMLKEIDTRLKDMKLEIDTKLKAINADINISVSDKDIIDREKFLRPILETIYSKDKIKLDPEIFKNLHSIITDLKSKSIDTDFQNTVSTLEQTVTNLENNLKQFLNDYESIDIKEEPGNEFKKSKIITEFLNKSTETIKEINSELMTISDILNSDRLEEEKFIAEKKKLDEELHKSILKTTNKDNIHLYALMEQVNKSYVDKVFKFIKESGDLRLLPDLEKVRDLANDYSKLSRRRISIARDVTMILKELDSKKGSTIKNIIDKAYTHTNKVLFKSKMNRLSAQPYLYRKEEGTDNKYRLVELINLTENEDESYTINYRNIKIDEKTDLSLKTDIIKQENFNDWFSEIELLDINLPKDKGPKVVENPTEPGTKVEEKPGTKAEEKPTEEKLTEEKPAENIPTTKAEEETTTKAEEKPSEKTMSEENNVSNIYKDTIDAFKFVKGESPSTSGVFTAEKPDKAFVIFENPEDQHVHIGAVGRLLKVTPKERNPYYILGLDDGRAFYVINSQQEDRTKWILSPNNILKLSNFEGTWEDETSYTMIPFNGNMYKTSNSKGIIYIDNLALVEKLKEAQAEENIEDIPEDIDFIDEENMRSNIDMFNKEVKLSDQEELEIPKEIEGTEEKQEQEHTEENVVIFNTTEIQDLDEEKAESLNIAPASIVYYNKGKHKKVIENFDLDINEQKDNFDKLIKILGKLTKLDENSLIGLIAKHTLYINNKIAFVFNTTDKLNIDFDKIKLFNKIISFKEYSKLSEAEKTFLNGFSTTIPGTNYKAIVFSSPALKESKGYRLIRKATKLENIYGGNYVVIDVDKNDPKLKIRKNVAEYEGYKWKIKQLKYSYNPAIKFMGYELRLNKIYPNVIVKAKLVKDVDYIEKYNEDGVPEYYMPTQEIIPFNKTQYRHTFVVNPAANLKIISSMDTYYVALYKMGNFKTFIKIPKKVYIREIKTNGDLSNKAFQLNHNDRSNYLILTDLEGNGVPFSKVYDNIETNLDEESDSDDMKIRSDLIHHDPKELPSEAVYFSHTPKVENSFSKTISPIIISREELEELDRVAQKRESLKVTPEQPKPKTESSYEEKVADIERRRQEELSTIEKTKSFYHGGLSEDFNINDLDVNRLAEKQQKRGRNYAGFYLYDETQKSGAETYSNQTGKGLHRFDIREDANILELGNIERVTKEQLEEYRKQGYDLIKGKDVRGRTEYVLLNKDVVVNVVNEKQINAKYDAELKALEEQPTPTTSNQSEIEAKIADIERRRQEELDKNSGKSKLINTPTQNKQEAISKGEKILKENKELVEQLEKEFTNEDETLFNQLVKKLEKLLNDATKGEASFAFNNGKIKLTINEVRKGNIINSNYTGSREGQIGQFEIGDSVQVNNGSVSIPATVTKVSSVGRIIEAEDKNGVILIRNGVVLSSNTIQREKEINAKYDAELKALEQDKIENDTVDVITNSNTYDSNTGDNPPTVDDSNDEDLNLVQKDFITQEKYDKALKTFNILNLLDENAESSVLDAQVENMFTINNVSANILLNQLKASKYKLRILKAKDFYPKPVLEYLDRKLKASGSEITIDDALIGVLYNPAKKSYAYLKEDNTVGFTQNLENFSNEDANGGIFTHFSLATAEHYTTSGILRYKLPDPRYINPSKFESMFKGVFDFVASKEDLSKLLMVYNNLYEDILKLRAKLSQEFENSKIELMKKYSNKKDKEFINGLEKNIKEEDPDLEANKIYQNILNKTRKRFYREKYNDYFSNSSLYKEYEKLFTETIGEVYRSSYKKTFINPIKSKLDKLSLSSPLMISIKNKSIGKANKSIDLVRLNEFTDITSSIKIASKHSYIVEGMPYITYNETDVPIVMDRLDSSDAQIVIKLLEALLNNSVVYSNGKLALRKDLVLEDGSSVDLIQAIKNIVGFSVANIKRDKGSEFENMLVNLESRIGLIQRVLSTSNLDKKDELSLNNELNNLFDRLESLYKDPNNLLNKNPKYHFFLRLLSKDGIPKIHLFGKIYNFYIIKDNNIILNPELVEALSRDLVGNDVTPGFYHNVNKSVLDKKTKIAKLENDKLTFIDVNYNDYISSRAKITNLNYKGFPLFLNQYISYDTDIEEKETLDELPTGYGFLEAFTGNNETSINEVINLALQEFYKIALNSGKYPNISKAEILTRYFMNKPLDDVMSKAFDILDQNLKSGNLDKSVKLIQDLLNTTSTKSADNEVNKIRNLLYNTLNSILESYKNEKTSLNEYVEKYSEFIKEKYPSLTTGLSEEDKKLIEQEEETKVLVKHYNDFLNSSLEHSLWLISFLDRMANSPEIKLDTESSILLSNIMDSLDTVKLSVINSINEAYSPVTGGFLLDSLFENTDIINTLPILLEKLIQDYHEGEEFSLIKSYNSPISNDEKKATIKKRFGNSVKLVIVDSLLNGKASGATIGNVIQLVENASKAVLDHESLEIAFKLLTEDERRDILNEAKNNPILKEKLREFKENGTYDQYKQIYGEDEDRIIKETLAEEFVDYVKSSGTKTYKNNPYKNWFFKLIWEFFNWIKSLLNKSYTIDQLFYDIENGNFKDRVFSDIDSTINYKLEQKYDIYFNPRIINKIFSSLDVLLGNYLSNNDFDINKDLVEKMFKDFRENKIKLPLIIKDEFSANLYKDLEENEELRYEIISQYRNKLVRSKLLEEVETLDSIVDDTEEDQLSNDSLSLYGDDRNLKFNIHKHISGNVRTLLLGIPKEDINELGLREAYPITEVIHKLSNILNGITSYDEALIIMKKNLNDNVIRSVLGRLYSLDSNKITKALDLLSKRTSFVQAFSKVPVNYVSLLLSKEGNTVINNSLINLENQVLIKLRNDYISRELKNKKLILRDISGKDISKKQDVQELFESNPKLANAVYEALGLNIINESEITYTDEEGNPCAKMGLTNTVKGTDWKIVKDFKGKPKHSNGGVDITISDKGVTIRRGGKDIKAKYGLLIINNN